MGYTNALYKLYVLCFLALRQVACRVKFEKLVAEESQLSSAFFNNQKGDLSSEILANRTR